MKYKVNVDGREFIVLADSNIQAVKKVRDKRFQDSAMRDDDKYDKIKDWYIKAYPSDSLGKEIDPRATFYGAWTTIFNYKTDIYDYIGVDDSVVRERIFKELSKRFGMTYDKIYNAWLSDSAIKDGLTSAEKHNRAMEKIFSNYDNQNNKMAEYLARHGVSSAEIEKLRQNTGLHGNALAEKIQKIGKWDDFWKNRDSAIEEEMDIEDLDETIYGSGEYIEEKLKDSDYIDYNGGTIRIGTGFEGMSGVPKGMDIKCEFYKKHNTFYDLIKWYPVGTPFNKVVDDFKRYINNHIKDSAIKDTVIKDSDDYSYGVIKEQIGNEAFSKELLLKKAYNGFTRGSMNKEEYNKLIEEIKALRDASVRDGYKFPRKIKRKRDGKIFTLKTEKTFLDNTAYYIGADGESEEIADWQISANPRNDWEIVQDSAIKDESTSVKGTNK